MGPMTTPRRGAKDNTRSWLAVAVVEMVEEQSAVVMEWREEEHRAALAAGTEGDPTTCLGLAAPIIRMATGRVLLVVVLEEEEEEGEPTMTEEEEEDLTAPPESPRWWWWW